MLAQNWIPKCESSLNWIIHPLSFRVVQYQTVPSHAYTAPPLLTPPPPVRWSATRRLSRTAVRHSCTYTTTQKDGGPATFISQGQQVKVARPEVRKAHQIMAVDRQETCCASVRNKRPCELLRCRAGPIWRPTPSPTLYWIAKANSSNLLLWKVSSYCCYYFRCNAVLHPSSRYMAASHRLWCPAPSNSNVREEGPPSQAYTPQ